MVTYEVCSNTDDLKTTYEMNTTALSELGLSPTPLAEFEWYYNAGHVVVAKDKDQVVGFLAFALIESVVRLILMYVLPEYRGQSVGTDLCMEAKKVWLAHGAKELHYYQHMTQTGFSQTFSVSLEDKDSTWKICHKVY